MLVVEGIHSDGISIVRQWMCCGHTWERIFAPDNIEEVAWTPVCPACGGYDESYS